MRGTIAVAGVCLLIGASSARAAAQESEPTSDDGAPASVEMSLSISPTYLIGLGALQLTGGAGVGSLGGLGGLGGLSALLPALDVGFALDRSTYLVVGLAGSFVESPTIYSISVPLSVLWYLEPPRVGRVMPMLRVGASLQYTHGDEPTGPALEALAVGALVHGGLTWLPDRAIGLRAEIGARAAVGDHEGSGGNGVIGGIGLDASISVVLRV